VDVRGSKKPRVFFETCAIGIGAAMASASQTFEKGRWETPGRTVPMALGMPPVITQIRLDGRRPQWVHTLLITVSNAPRAGLACSWRRWRGWTTVCLTSRSSTISDRRTSRLGCQHWRPARWRAATIRTCVGLGAFR